MKYLPIFLFTIRLRTFLVRPLSWPRKNRLRLHSEWVWFNNCQPARTIRRKKSKSWFSFWFDFLNQFMQRICLTNFFLFFFLSKWFDSTGVQFACANSTRAKKSDTYLVCTFITWTVSMRGWCATSRVLLAWNQWMLHCWAHITPDDQGHFDWSSIWLALHPHLSFPFSFFFQMISMSFADFYHWFFSSSSSKQCWVWPRKNAWCCISSFCKLKRCWRRFRVRL